MTDAPRRAWVEQIMGLPESIHLRGPEPDAQQAHVARAFAELRRADAVFSPYRDDPRGLPDPQTGRPRYGPPAWSRDGLPGEPRHICPHWMDTAGTSTRAVTCSPTRRAVGRRGG